MDLPPHPPASQKITMKVVGDSDTWALSSAASCLAYALTLSVVFVLLFGFYL